MRRPIQSTDRLLEPTPMSFRLSNTPSTSRSVRSLRTEASAGTRVGSTSARRSATSSSGSNPSVPICGKSISVLLPSGGLTKNSSSFSTPTATQDVTQSVNHQLAPLCQPSGALFTARALHWRDRRPRLPSGRSTDPVDARGLGCGVRTGWTQRLAVPRSQANRRPQSGGGRSLKIGGDELHWPRDRVSVSEVRDHRPRLAGGGRCQAGQVLLHGGREALHHHTDPAVERLVALLFFCRLTA